ncbi:DUF6412 domain-containing protein [Streptomyces sp. NPDC048415]
MYSRGGRDGACIKAGLVRARRRRACVPDAAGRRRPRAPGRALPTAA